MDRRGGNAGAQALTRRLLSLSTLYPAPGRTGFGRFVQRQMEALAQRGDWDVTVINPIGLPPLPPLLSPKRYVPLRMIPAVESAGPVSVHHPRFMLIPGLSGRFNPALIARAVLPLARRLHAEQPFDMVDAQFFYPDGPAAARISKALGLPLAIKARGSDIHYWGAQAAAFTQMRAAADQAATLLSVSGALAQDMAALGLPADKTRVHYTGLDHARFHPVPRAAAREQIAALPGLDLPASGKLLLSVGALVPVKGMALALEALAQLPADTILVIAGEGPEGAALRALAERLGLATRVRFAGAVGHETLPLLLSAADAMVLPSEREGLANAWIEALACGTPLVIPPIGGAHEVVDRPAAGRIVARDAHSIAAGIADVLATPVPPEAVAECAARFSWETNAAALAEIYGAIVTQ